MTDLADDAGRGGRFLLLSGIQLERAQSEVHCRVQLSRSGKIFTGESREMDTPSGRMRAAARAALAAAEQAAPGTSLGLEGITIIQLFSRSYAVASVEAGRNRQFALLAGLATVDAGRALEDSAVLAILGAIDRWIATI